MSTSLQTMFAGTVYIVVSPSGKAYVGQTLRDVNKRKREHATTPGCRLLKAAFDKYGALNMCLKVLIRCPANQLDFWETTYIAMYDTLSPHGYNVRTGGAFGLHCQASKELMRQAKLGNKNHNFGKPRTPAAKANISAAKKGPLHHFYGQKFVLHHRQKLSDAHRKDASNALPMYVVEVAARPERYIGPGYAVPSHPTLPKKYWCSKKLTMDDKLRLAKEYLASAEESPTTERRAGRRMPA